MNLSERWAQIWRGVACNAQEPGAASRALAQRYAEVRKGMGLKIVGFAADSILQVLVSKINPILRVPLRSFARDLNKLERGYLYERMSRESLDSR